MNDQNRDFTGSHDGGHDLPVTATPAPVKAPAMVNHDIAQLVGEIRARVKATKQLKTAMLSLTSPLDWVGQERWLPDKNVEHVPYLQESGAINLFHAFGVRLLFNALAIEFDLQPGQIEPRGDGTFEVVFDGTVRATEPGSNWIFVVGSSWSGDPLFARQGGKADPGDVRKAALTNWYQNAVIAILGLKNVTWDELRAAGVNPDRVGRVT